MRLVRFLYQPRVCRNPVHFPVLSPINGACPFKMAPIRSDVRYTKANEDRLAIQCFLIKNLAASILELPDRGLAYATPAAVGEIETPLTRFGIVKAQAQTLKVAR